jgi:tripartite-type tricarboxylate transporter receptor subunit TctC
MKNARELILSVLAVTLLAAPHAAWAQAFPSRTVRIIVPFAPGGSADFNARLIAKAMTEQLGQSVVVDNKAGAGGIIGATEAVRAAPDGYTMFFATNSFVTAPLFNPNLAFHPLRDFTPVSMVMTLPFLLTVNPEVPAKTVAELISYAKANPGKINYGSGGAGGLGHLSGVFFAERFGLKITQVPYRGNAAVIPALLAGQVQMTLITSSDVLPHLPTGRLRALAITSPQRSDILPDVPTLAEATGQKDFAILTYGGLLVPKGTPKNVVARLETEVDKAVHSAEVRRQLVSTGQTPMGGTSEQMLELLTADMARWEKVIKEANIKLEQ